jgi:hypothetical protein
VSEVTAYLGTYDDFQQELVIEILTEHGIFATAKTPTTENEHSAYPAVFSDRGVVLVDADRVDEAKRIINEELPAHLASIAEAMEALENAPDEADEEPDAH